ncbi:MAG: hypothetical protein ACLUFN_06820 [Eubacterium sp.]
MKKKTSKLKKLLCMIIALIMAVSTMPLTAFAAQSSVSYRDAAWDGSQVVFTDKTATCTSVESSSSAVTWTEGWYVVSGTVTVSDTITVSGAVDLVLTDGCTLNAQKGIVVTSGNQLTVYGQTESSGKLVATGTSGIVSGISVDIAGIGGNSYLGQSGSTCGTVIINGGNITATGGQYAAGIGGAGYSYKTHNGGTITINAGTVNAKGGDSAAGIGGGNYGSGGNITINGGTVTANGGNYYGAGIGGGQYGSGGNITINDGTVKATGGINAAGIGAGNASSSGSGGTITITGGDVTAQGGSGGSGIGSTNGNTGTITISGGKVRAVGGASQSGIGGSYCTGGNITISGGYVEALCDNASGIDRAQGIGGKSGVNFSTGENGSAVIIASNINDGTVEDKSAWSGLIFEGSSGQVYSDEITLSQDLTVASGATLTIPEGATLIVPAGTTLNNKGSIVNNGSLIVNGTCSGNTVSGSGTILIPPALVDGTYQISTADELMWFANYVNSGNPNVNAKLTADIDLAGVDYTPIGTADYPFEGTFDGQNHTISNMNITASSDNQGLFGYTEYANISYLTVKGSIVCTQSCAAVGGVVGFLYDSTLSDINSYVDITDTGVEMHHVGGVVGAARTYSTVRRCMNYGNVNLTNAVDCVGGVAGYANEYVNIYYCANLGTVHSDSADAIIGGILGYVNNNRFTQLTSCYNAGSVECPTDTHCGGIIGWARSISSSDIISNNYYLEGSALPFGTGSVECTAQAKTAEQFKSGEVAYLLGSRYFGQKIGQEDYPVISGDSVYSYNIIDCLGNSVTAYSNDSSVTDIEKGHTFGEWTTDGDSHTRTCTVCGNTESGTHTYGGWSADGDVHSKVCTVCGSTLSESHTFDDNGFCTECGDYEPAVYNSSSDEYEISNAGQLMWFAEQVNSGNTDIDGGLVADIDLAGVDYTPIGTAQYPYEGYFFGYGHTVSNMNITADSDYQGMFGYTYAAHISMLTVKGTITCTESISAVGGVVGFADGTSIGYVNSYVDITDTGVELHRVGGIAGLLGKWSAVSASMNFGSINLTSTVDSIGGIVGYVDTVGRISACANHGTIHSDAPDAYIGGILGCVDSTSFEGVLYCYNLGSIENPTDKYCGAITGWAKTIVSSEIFYNDYYLEGSANAPLGTESGTCTAQAKTAEQFKSGEVTYLMSKARYYGQEIGVQDYPVIDGYPVYQYENLACSGQSKDPAVYLYSNEQKENFTDEHSFKDGVCQVCGAYEDGIGARLAGYTLSLKGNIGVNFHMSLDESVANSETAYMQFTLPNGDVTKINVSDADVRTVNGKDYYVFSCEVAAKEMTDTITAQIIDGDKTGTVYTYTVKEYADYILAHQDDNTEYANAAALVKAMLNYGSYAQINFNNTANGLANDSEYITDTEKDISSVTAETLEQFKNEETRENDFVKFEGSNLSLLSQTTLRLWFTIKDKSKLDSITFTCEGNPLEPVKSGSYYYIEITDIAAKDLDKDYVVTVSDDTESLDVNFSVMAYCYDVLNREITASRTQELKNTVAALYLYNVEANNYFEV